MKRLVNARYALFPAFAVGLGAGISYLLSYNSLPYWWLIPAVPVFAALLIAFIVRKNNRALVFTAISAALFIYGALGVGFRLSSFASTDLTHESTYTVSGTVYEKAYTESGEYVKLNNLVAGGESVDGCMIVYLDSEYGEYCDVGYNISFYGVVYVSSPFAYGSANSERLLEDVRYSAYPLSGISSEYGFSLFGAINSGVRSLYFDNMDKGAAAISYAMFTGNTQYIETSAMDSFRYGGVAHVFAVSGLHIALVYAFVTAILKRLRVGAVASAIVSIFLIFFYTGVCGFTLSAVRAAIMCAVSAVLRLASGKYDGLSSLALAFTVIMLVNPLNIISVGFQLSVAAVAGICLFYAGIKSALRRIKIPDKIAASAAVSLSAQIGTFPILLSCFGYVSWASLFMNIIFVPLISAVFTVLFACTFLAAAITPLTQFILMIPAVPTEAITTAIVSIRAEQALISGFDFGAFTPLYFIAAVILSGKVNIKIRFRVLIACLLAVVIAAGVVLKNWLPAGAARLIVSGYYNGSCCVLIRTDEGTVLVISETPSAYDISSLLQENSAEISAVVILGGEESVFAYNQLGIDCGQVYVYYQNIPIQPYPGVDIIYQRQFTVCGIDFEYMDGSNIVAETSDISVGISCGDTVSVERCDLLIAEQTEHDCECATAVYFGSVDFAYNAYDCGDLHFVLNDGRIFITGNAAKKGALL